MGLKSKKRPAATGWMRSSAAGLYVYRSISPLEGGSGLLESLPIITVMVKDKRARRTRTHDQRLTDRHPCRSVHG